MIMICYICKITLRLPEIRERTIFFRHEIYFLGHGEFETLILDRSLPMINHVIAVEPDVKFNDKIIKALNSPNDRTIKVSKPTR